ncbi:MULTISPECIES: rhomboid family intramembrane serine protease [unclassified Polaromonas]|uniref:rhomboid family protein n=1 Tax=unclassified Polaromonas TaxID=2638319 RepID=UPI000F07977D|nr:MULTISPECIES: rhomboid family intramembrane serine protease [unclassified Polaromonas]AYQ28238.1 rhomboid family intramembrane serine protease [Polaromonas sp. SP1]QGJ20640.1 rhomboid family intramembrane serine protease [Polaromonas sp. Pch-P]
MDFPDTVPSAEMAGDADARESVRDYVREFPPSWRSTTGTLTILFSFLAAIPALMLLFVPFSGFPGWRVVSLGGLLWFVWLLGRQLVGGRPALRVGPEGISAATLKNRTIAWTEVSDIESQTVQGNTSINVSLAPHVKDKWWWGSRKKRLGISLSSIRTKDHAEAIVAATQAFAAYGGRGFMQAMEQRTAELKAVENFDARLKQLTPVTWALYLVVCVNVAVWLANLGAGISAFKPLPSELLAWGANSAASVVEDRQYWRLLTATFLHGGFLHLALNMLGLWEAGRQLNRLHGNLQFLLIYLASALTGSALSLHYSAQQSVSVGASGAVFGVLGALLVAMYQHRGQIPGITSKNVMTSQGVFLAYALVQGFSKQGIDNAAHVGGLIAGCVLAWMLTEKIAVVATPARRLSTAAIGALLSGVAVAALVVTTPAPAVHHRQLFEFQAGLTRILPLMKATEKAFQADVKALREGKMTEEQFAQALQTQHLPGYQAVQRALAPLDVPANDKVGAGMRDVKRANSLVVEVMQIQLANARAVPGDAAAAAGQARIDVINTELRAINARISERVNAAKPKP